MKVLIPVQDATFGDAITTLVTNHNWPKDTEFELLTVVDYESYGHMVGEMYCCQQTHAIYDQRQTEAKYLLETYAKKLDYAMPGSFVHQKIAAGNAKELILEEAEDWGADMIVMGSHARKGLSRFLLGSVSTAVLSQSPCSVIIVKLPKEHPAKAENAEAKHEHLTSAARTTA